MVLGVSLFQDVTTNLWRWCGQRDVALLGDFAVYCTPFEGEHHLFSRCISTTSCDTDYSITVSNDSVCFAELSPPLTSIPVYFTLLESCANSRCVIRSVLASYYFDNAAGEQLETHGTLHTGIWPGNET